MSEPTPSVFLDPSGKRWRAIQRATVAMGILTTLVALGLGITFLIPPILPRLQAAKRAVGVRPPRLNTTRSERERSLAKRKLAAALAQSPAPAATHAEQLRVEKNLATESAARALRTSANANRPRIVAGFYVNWDDNSFASFKAHANDMDWVICEWVFLTAGGDSLKFLQDNKVLFLAQNLPPKDRPRIFAMVSNFDSKLGHFDAVGVRRLLETKASRQRAAVQLVKAAQKFALAGITLDLEEVPDDLHPALIDFMRMLRAGLAPGGRMLTAAVAASTNEELARHFAASNDYLFLMLYDQHFGRGDPGPVASQSWYVERARRLLGSADLRIGQLSEVGFPAGSFDAITCWDVIEHTRNPVAFLRETARLLKPGGRLFLTVPNVGTRHARLLGRYWEGFAKIREHLFYFTPATADRALELAGFERLHQQPSGPSVTLGFLASKLARYSNLISRAAQALLKATHLRDAVVGFPFIDILVVARRRGPQET